MIGVSIKQFGTTYPMNINLEKAARLIGVSRPSMVRLIENGLVEGRKNGHSWVVSTRSVIAYLGLEGEVVNND